MQGTWHTVFKVKLAINSLTDTIHYLAKSSMFSHKQILWGKKRKAKAKENHISPDNFPELFKYLGEVIICEGEGQVGYINCAAARGQGGASAGRPWCSQSHHIT